VELKSSEGGYDGAKRDGHLGDGAAASRTARNDTPVYYTPGLIGRRTHASELRRSGRPGRFVGMRRRAGGSGTELEAAELAWIGGDDDAASVRPLRKESPVTAWS